MVPKHHPFSTAESPVGRTASKMSFGDGCSTSRLGRQSDGESRLLQVTEMFLGTNCICVGMLSFFCKFEFSLVRSIYLSAKIPCCLFFWWVASPVRRTSMVFRETPTILAPRCQALGRTPVAVWPELREAAQREPQLMKAGDKIYGGCEC